MDLGAWLRSLSLERYETAFRENEIDETVLPSLTHETLKELGVTASVTGSSCSMPSLLCGATRVARRHQLTQRARQAARAPPPKTAPSAAKSL